VPSGGRPVAFGYKCAWLAVRHESPDAVARAIELGNGRASAWDAGIEAAYAGSAFVTPPLDGWILVVSTRLGELIDNDSAGLVASMVERLSGALATTVMYFVTHRVVELHAWARAECGVLVRHYAYLGESDATLADVGAPSEAERDLQLPPDEETVLTVAARWSIAPLELDSRDETPPGLLGELP
jgi:hypothetical protein